MDSGAGHATVSGVKQLLLTAALLSGAAFLTTASAQTAPATTPASAAATTPAPAKDPATLVGRVGKEDLTLAEFDRAFRLAAARVVNSQGIPFEDAYLAEFAEARPDFLKQFVRDRAVYQLARARQQADPAELDRQIADARSGFETDEEFAEALNATGYTDTADLRRELERQLIVGAYLGGVQERFTFGDALVAGYYNLHRADFAREQEACVKHILVPTQAEAQAITKDLAGGADFAKLAAEKSQDPGSAAQGGDLGCFGPGQMVETFDTASFKGPVNAVQTVQSQFGWHVLVVTKRTEAGTVPLADAAPVIRDQLGKDAAQKYLDAQVARLSTESFPDVVTVAAPAPADK
ncbi:peptidylprolyl isomerase [Deinococcus seoulensis]|uniref:Peptidylprolyl isomerase n=1 Tax=Deinococcus seoulensis TaxID=1837379 RepID=A0ABQ2RKH7_9DEIO|nr:peptidylprolyl isomerase [Deinococcus seoulensis]